MTRKKRAKRKGRKAERAAIVMWLRSGNGASVATCETIAAAIEKGAHHGR